MEGAPLDENDFLGLINAEAIKALQEGEGSSDGNSISSSSDSEVPDDLAIVEEEVKHLFGGGVRGRGKVPLDFVQNSTPLTPKTHFVLTRTR